MTFYGRGRSQRPRDNLDNAYYWPREGPKACGVRLDFNDWRARVSPYFRDVSTPSVKELQRMVKALLGMEAPERAGILDAEALRGVKSVVILSLQGLPQQHTLK
eukprot:scaffold8138_cov277-Pinguiococcus_pyrenoidosus.AAC.2